MSAGRCITLALVLGLGCLPSVDLALPVQEPAGVFIFVRGLNSDTPEAWAVDASPDAPPITWPSASEITLLVYPAGTVALQLALGPIALVPKDQPGRRLPPPREVWTGRTEQAVVNWQPLPALTDAERDRLRVARFDLNLCAAQGGCNLDPDDALCSLPCPTPQAPTGPALPQLTDNPAWVPMLWDGQPWIAPDGRPVLGPRVPDRLLCPLGQMRRPDEAACRPIQPCPAVGTWPAGLSGDTVYVRQDSIGGDGSAQRPWASLSEALSLAPRDAPIMFEGRFDLDALVLDHAVQLSGRPVQGVCPDRAQLWTADDRVFEAGNLNLAGLTLDLGGDLILGGGPASQHSLQRVQVVRGVLAPTGARLLVSDSSFVSEAEIACTASYGGSLDVRGSYSRTYYGIHAYADASVRVRDSLFEAPSGAVGHGISCSRCDHIDVESSVFRGFGAAGISASQTPRIRLVQSQLLDIGNRGIELNLCERADCLPADAFAITATISDVYIRSDKSAIGMEAGALTLSDAVLESQTSALTLLGNAGYRLEARLHRVVVRDVNESGIELRGGPGAPRVVDMQDLLIRPRSASSLYLRSAIDLQFSDSTLQRVYIDGNTGYGIDIACGGGRLNDIVINNVDTVGLRLYPHLSLTADRVRVTGGAGAGVLISPDANSAFSGIEACTDLVSGTAPSVQLTDLEVTGTGDSETGLTVCRGAVAHVQRAQIKDFKTGVYLQHDLLRLSEGTLSNNGLGLSVAADLDVSTALLGVTYEGTTRVVEVRGFGDDVCPY